MAKEPENVLDGDNVSLTEDTNSWMSEINDDKSIAEMLIPGTHGSATFHWGYVYKCQSWTVEMQLKQGIRFMDLHVRKWQDELYIHQRNSYQFAKLYDILQTVLNYLKRNSRECVLIRIWEDKIRRNDPGIWRIVHRDVTKLGVQNFWLKNEIPTLGKVRGNIVVIKNFNGSEMGIEHDLLDELQAAVPTLFHMPSAWRNIKKHIEKAKVDGVLRISYCSDASWVAFPCHIAEYFNAKLLQFFEEVHDQTHSDSVHGIIAMDFPDCHTVKNIIEANF